MGKCIANSCKRIGQRIDAGRRCRLDIDHVFSERVAQVCCRLPIAWDKLNEAVVRAQDTHNMTNRAAIGEITVDSQSLRLHRVGCARPGTKEFLRWASAGAVLHAKAASMTVTGKSAFIGFMANDAAQWRAANDARYETEAQPARPLPQPG